MCLETPLTGQELLHPNKAERADNIALHHMHQPGSISLGDATGASSFGLKAWYHASHPLQVGRSALTVTSIFILTERATAVVVSGKTDIAISGDEVRGRRDVWAGP
jgi:hypothetical protein